MNKWTDHVVRGVVTESVLLLSGVVFSFEQVDDVLVGTHVAVSSAILTDVIGRWDTVTAKWKDKQVA